MNARNSNSQFQRPPCLSINVELHTVPSPKRSKEENIPVTKRCEISLNGIGLWILLGLQPHDLHIQIPLMNNYTHHDIFVRCHYSSEKRKWSTIELTSQLWPSSACNGQVKLALTTCEPGHLFQEASYSTQWFCLRQMLEYRLQIYFYDGISQTPNRKQEVSGQVLERYCQINISGGNDANFLTISMCNGLHIGLILHNFRTIWHMYKDRILYTCM